MILGITGHRPEKLGSYTIPNPIYTRVMEKTKQILLDLKPDKVITGMALGYDQYVAALCVELDIPFLAAVPFAGQESVWPAHSKKTYQELISKSSEIVVVSAGGYAAFKMQIRNKYIVDNSDQMLAAFDGTPGGTANCIAYARSQGKNIKIINPKEI